MNFFLTLGAVFVVVFVIIALGLGVGLPILARFADWAGDRIQRVALRLYYGPTR